MVVNNGMIARDKDIKLVRTALKRNRIAVLLEPRSDCPPICASHWPI